MRALCVIRVPDRLDPIMMWRVGGTAFPFVIRLVMRRGSIHQPRVEDCGGRAALPCLRSSRYIHTNSGWSPEYRWVDLLVAKNDAPIHTTDTTQLLFFAVRKVEAFGRALNNLFLFKMKVP